MAIKTSKGIRITLGRHIPALDGVRGLAVMTVFLYHYGGGAQSTNPIVHGGGIAAQFGWCGVTLFFVLSGFLITGILWDSRGQQHWWRNFYVRRSLRIFPLYYFSLLVIFIASLAVHDHKYLGTLGIFLLYLQNMPFCFRWDINSATGLHLYHFWSLAVEEQFYLVWPFLIQGIPSRRSAKALCVAVFIGSFLFRAAGYKWGWENLGFLTLSRMGELAAGAWLALRLRGSQQEWEILQRWSPAVAMTGFAGICVIAWHQGDFKMRDHSHMTMTGLVLTAAVAGALLCMAISGTYIRRILELRFLRWLGGISYGVYVYHVLLIDFFENLGARFTHNRSVGSAHAVALMLAFPSVLLLAMASYRWLEAPLLRLKNRYPERKRVETAM